jgi:hypothetical protein
MDTLNWKIFPEFCFMKAMERKTGESFLLGGGSGRAIAQILLNVCEKEGALSPVF